VSYNYLELRVGKCP